MNRGDLKSILRVVDQQHGQEVRSLDEIMLEVKALVGWIFEASGGQIFCRLSVDELPENIRANFDRNLEVLSAYLEATGEAWKEAARSLEPAGWEALRVMLSMLATWGIPSVPMGFKGKDGVDSVFYLGLAGNGISGHTEGGDLSFLWTEERSLELWLGDGPIN